MTTFSPGDTAIWIGTAGLFSQPVKIIAARNAYLQIFGETPEDGHRVYDIDASPRIKGTVYGIDPSQLLPAS